MLKIWRWYTNCLAVHPVKTQVISSGLIWGLGDLAAQAVTRATAVKKKNLFLSVSFPHHSSPILTIPYFPSCFCCSSSSCSCSLRLFLLFAKIIFCLLDGFKFHLIPSSDTYLSLSPFICFYWMTFRLINMYDDISFTQQDEDNIHINWRRVVTTSIFGMAFVGPIGHFWLVFSYFASFSTTLPLHST